MSLLSGVIRPNQIGRLQVSSRPRSLRGFWSLSIPRSTRSGNAAAVLCRTRHWIRLSIVTEFGESSFWRLKHSFLPLVTNGKKTTTHFVGLPTRFWGQFHAHLLDRKGALDLLDAVLGDQERDT